MLHTIDVGQYQCKTNDIKHISNINSLTHINTTTSYNIDYRLFYRFNKLQQLQQLNVYINITEQNIYQNNFNIHRYITQLECVNNLHVVNKQYLLSI